MAMNIVLVNPEIPQNTGNIARTCAATGAVLHLIEPLGFSLDDRYLKRAVLDYWHLMKYYVYPDLETFLKQHEGARMFFASTKSPASYHEAEYHDGDFIFFGCETRGLPENLLESELFGYDDGAFTGASKHGKMGLFELANGGTLFLDEIGELLPEAQALLLRVLEGGRFMRVGGKEELEVDVRLITATNRNLPIRVRDGKFRADLFQRLNVVQLRIPSLREHKEDIADIANAWWRKHHDNATLTEKQIAALGEYDYPGNVRELLNILDRATVLEETDFETLMKEHREMNAGLIDVGCTEQGIVPDDLEGATRYHVRKVYDKYGQNLTKTASALNVSRNTVRKYL